jgi:hypothetical protein
MTKPSYFKAKSAGRLPVGRDPVVPVRIPPSLLEAVDKYAKSPNAGRRNRHSTKSRESLTRSAAIRELIVKGLGNVGRRAAAKAQREHDVKHAEALVDRHEGMREAIAQAQSQLHLRLS